jgi:hypothetical protein
MNGNCRGSCATIIVFSPARVYPERPKLFNRTSSVSGVVILGKRENLDFAFVQQDTDSVVRAVQAAKNNAASWARSLGSSLEESISE